jgi:hypothetical protein
MNVELRAARVPLTVVVEPWGDEIAVPAETAVELVCEGEAIEPLRVEAIEPNVLRLSVPRFVTLRVRDAAGLTIREYDTRALPPLPPGFRP